MDLKQLGLISLVAAWFCASGAMLDLVQVVAWARMFSNYARSMPVTEAAVETMDPGKPCPICLAVRRARAGARDQQQPATSARAAEKQLLVSQESAGPVVARPDRAEWPEVKTGKRAIRTDRVPVPPPRA